MNARRNPVLDLPAARRLELLPTETRLVLRDVLLELADQANDAAESSWRRRKGPMAAYWRAVSTYAKHLARATITASDRARLELDAGAVAVDAPCALQHHEPEPYQPGETEPDYAGLCRFDLAAPENHHAPHGPYRDLDRLRFGLLRMAGTDRATSLEIASAPPVPADWTESELRFADGDR